MGGASKCRLRQAVWSRCNCPLPPPKETESILFSAPRHSNMPMSSSCKSLVWGSPNSALLWVSSDFEGHRKNMHAPAQKKLQLLTPAISRFQLAQPAKPNEIRQSCVPSKALCCSIGHENMNASTLRCALKLLGEA